METRDEIVCNDRTSADTDYSYLLMYSLTKTNKNKFRGNKRSTIS